MGNGDNLILLILFLIPLIGIGLMCLLACMKTARNAEDEINLTNEVNEIHVGAICPKKGKL